MYFPKVLRYPASSDRFIDTVGFTLAGMLQVTVYELEPTDVSPEYVVIVRVIETDDPVVFC